MLIEYLSQTTGIYLLSSRLFSTGMATVVSFVLAMLLFPSYIRFLRKMQVSSEFGNATGVAAGGGDGNAAAVKGPEGPVMPAGLLFFGIIIIATLATVRINAYVVSALVIYCFFSIIGAADDIAKVVNQRKVARGEMSQKDYQYKADGISSTLRLALYLLISLIVAVLAYKYIPNINKSMNIPFFSVDKWYPDASVWLFIPLMTLTIAVMANGVNFTDGFDTLATVPSITCLTFLGIISFVASNSIWSTFLLIPYIPGLQEILPLIGAIIGTLLAYLWFNSPPSTIIMGDSGSVGLGGFIGIMFIFSKSEFFLPIVGFIFLLEFCSVFMQMGWFKLTKKRIFKCAPIHHHFQFGMRAGKRYGEGPLAEFKIKSKIMWRFHILSIILMIVGLILFLKVR
ncbi:MAG: phospho-N-acetylmuramoyl-pentapeptide-transferase [Chitinispirillia bacterium]|nr:phospho-N-acetylmuramoyl-pentapeptide-transferase [Chitinispirillia bacterium]MCL2241185.1 phospho-N-acetylmuramoyl-pentapeptide-transferase [Chitinispirillia bacterium]